MDAFTAGYLANLASSLTGYLVSGARKSLRESLQGTEEQQALARSVEAGLVALLTTASAQSPQETGLLADIFQIFFTDEEVGEEVGWELAALLKGRPPNMEALSELFEEAGFEAETLPGLDFEQGMQAFTAAFVSAAAEEPALQEMIQTGQLVTQTNLQREMLATMRQLVAALRQRGQRELGIQAGTITIQHQSEEPQIIFQWPPAGSGPAIGRPEVRRRYLSELARETNRLQWAVVEREYADPEGGESLGLAEVYTALDTTELEQVDHEAELRRFMARLEQEETRRIPALEMVDREQRLLILGDPGSGKSTFVNYLAYTLAQAGLAADPADWLVGRLSPWSHGWLLPVKVELRALATELAEPGRGRASLILDHLHQNLAAWHLEACWPVVEENLRSDEESLLVLLDGLDEVPTSLRQTVVQAVQELAERYPQHRYVVTCRPYAYVGQPWPLRGFTEVTLAPFDQEQIEAFIATWYRELARRQRLTDQEAQDKTIQLQRAVRQGDLWGLARRPLLLTVMTLLHSFRGQLPEDRTELYADAVDLLLRRWEQRVSGEAGLLERLAMPGLKLSDLEAGLYDVAFKAHSAATAVSDTADVAEAELRAWLAPYLGDDWNKAGQFVAYIRERAGLLVRHKTEAYTFPHRTFQEFMAACHLVTRVADYPGEAARLVRAEPDRWREVFVLAAGHAARTHRLGQAIAAVNALCPAAVEETDQPGAAAFRRAMLAGEALLEIGLIGVRREEAGRVALSRIQSWLPAALGADQELEARERAAAGNTLARLDDPRPGIGTISALRGEGAIPDLHFCHVPAGPFWLGEDEEKHLNESLNYDYWLSRYPVTNAQFAAFVEAGGYRQPGYWPEARAAKVWQDGRVQDRHDDRPRTGPVDFGEPFNLPNHPVVGLTWYEALAFCRWLGERIANCDLANLPMSQAQQQVWATIQTEIGNHQSKITLPSEAEWEKAARGPSTGSGGPSTGFASGRGRLYPWGDEPDPNRANYNDSGIGATSPVGCFPGGKSPYGCEEMSGNVWEWTRSLWGKDWGRPDYKYPYDPADGREDLTLGTDVLRVLRGGAFGNNRNLVRGAVRLRDDPDSWSDLIGFRVVVVGVASR